MQPCFLLLTLEENEKVVRSVGVDLRLLELKYIEKLRTPKKTLALKPAIG